MAASQVFFSGFALLLVVWWKKVEENLRGLPNCGYSAKRTVPSIVFPLPCVLQTVISSLRGKQFPFPAPAHKRYTSNGVGTILHPPSQLSQIRAAPISESSSWNRTWHKIFRIRSFLSLLPWPRFVVPANSLVLYPMLFVWSCFHRRLKLKWLM